MESVTASPVDPLIVKTICEQLDVINKLLVKARIAMHQSMRKMMMNNSLDLKRFASVKAWLLGRR